MEINKIYHENCLDTMAKMDDNFVNCTITSPPYDEMRTFGGHNTFDFEKIASELYRVTAIGGILVWVVGDQTIKGNETGTSFRHALHFKDIGFNLWDTMIYAKLPRPAVGNMRGYWQSFEYMFVFSKDQPKTVNLIQDRENKELRKARKVLSRQPDGSMRRKFTKKQQRFSRRTNIWSYATGKYNSSKDEQAFDHPAVFPEKLAQDHIKTWSDEGDLIYDPFMGSGTVAKMAILEKRNYIGSEINKEYWNIIEKRIKHVKFQSRLV